ncbi:MAG: hypothetical protein EXR98_12490 [Gemmataceae bacterium]|nr:hypothetical protein [Gemmataceae bacterium]
MTRIMLHCGACGLLWALCATIGSGQDVASLLIRIKAVGKEGVGNVEASKAWKELVAKGPGVMPDVLAGMDDANPVAVNWLRAAVEAIQDKAAQTGQKIPAEKIDAFLKDTRHNGRARRLAYECLVRLDPKTPDRLLPKMLDDPSSEIRRDAVAVKLKDGKDSKFDSTDTQKKYFHDLLNHARDRDQVNAISAELKKLKVEIDLTTHFGFVTRWLLIGPFDNVKGVGFHNAYPPEKGFDLKSEFLGKADAQVRWKEHATEKPLGMIDLNEAVGKLKGAVVYAYAAVASESERAVELRAGSNNAVRMWLNGKEVYFREEYHHGMEMDQHVGKGVLKKGRNEILIKVCQNEQTDSWAQLWSFQLRVCDALGAATPVTNMTEKVK